MLHKDFPLEHYGELHRAYLDYQQGHVLMLVCLSTDGCRRYVPVRSLAELPQVEGIVKTWEKDGHDIGYPKLLMTIDLRQPLPPPPH